MQTQWQLDARGRALGGAGEDVTRYELLRGRRAGENRGRRCPWLGHGQNTRAGGGLLLQAGVACGVGRLVGLFPPGRLGMVRCQNTTDRLRARLADLHMLLLMMDWAPPMRQQSKVEHARHASHKQHQQD